VTSTAIMDIMDKPNDAQPPEWKQLEILIAEIQRQLAPGAKVTHNARLMGQDSETMRQIDVLVEQSVGQFRMMIVIDCKDYGHPVDVKGVEEFRGMVEDVRAHHGSMVSAKGFTRSAKKVARRANIALYSPIDTAPHKWQTTVALPVLCEFRAASLSFKIRSSAPAPFKMPQDFFSSLMVFDGDGNELGTCVEVALNRWNEGEYPVEIGVHEDVPIFAVTSVYVDNGYGMRIPVGLTVFLDVKGRRYFGHLPLKEIRGLRDEQTGEVHTNAFTTGALDPVEVENQWLRLSADEAPPGPVTLTIMGLNCFEIEGRRTRR
jgi:hypothetical protein